LENEYPFHAEAPREVGSALDEGEGFRSIFRDKGLVERRSKEKMIDQDKMAFARLMTYFQDIFVPGKPISKEKIAIYFDILSSYSFSDICSVADTIMRTKKISTFPLPFEFLTLLGEGNREDKNEIRALRAWNEACSIIHSGSRSDDGIINEAIRVAFGGWERFGETDPKSEAFDRKHFIECFKSLLRTDFRKPEEIETTLLKQLAETREKIKKLKE